MRIRMMQTIRGSRDGVNLEAFEKGQEYDFGDDGREADLARVFVREGWAESPKAKIQPEVAAVLAAPENASPRRRRP